MESEETKGTRGGDRRSPFQGVVGALVLRKEQVHEDELTIGLTRVYLLSRVNASPADIHRL